LRRSATDSGKRAFPSWPLVAATIAVVAFAVLMRYGAPRAAWAAPTAVSFATAAGKPFLLSLALALCATALALLLAFPVGVYLGARGGGKLAACALIPLVMPPHVAAYVWRYLLDALAAALTAGGPWWRSQAWCFWGSAWTLAALFWPVIALPVAVGMRLTGNRLQQELANLAPPGPVFWRAVVRGLAPAFVAGTGLCFLLSMANYGVPLMWNIPAQSVIIHARLAAYYGSEEVLAMSMPLQLTVFAGCLAGVVWLARRSYRVDFALAALPSAARGSENTQLRAGAYAVLVLTAGLPLVALAVSPGMAGSFVADLLAGARPYAWGLAIAALGATGATAAGVALGRAMRGPRGILPMAVEVVGICLLFMPAPVLCLALAWALNRPGLPGRLYDSIAVFVPAYGLRFFYIPWKLTRLANRFESFGQHEAERLMGLGRYWRTRLALGGTLRLALCAGWLVVFAFALGELEIATFRAQPGRQPVSVLLDNLMHYGRSGALVKWSLILILTEIATAWAVLAMGARQCRRLCAAD